MPSKRLKRGKRTAADSTSLRLFSSKWELLSVNCSCLFTLQQEMIQPRRSYIWFTHKSCTSKLLFLCDLQLQSTADTLWESFLDTHTAVRLNIINSTSSGIWNRLRLNCLLSVLITVINMPCSIQRNALQTPYGWQCEQQQHKTRLLTNTSFLPCCSGFKCISTV